MRVLIADDNGVLRAVLRAMLRDEGYEVVGEAPNLGRRNAGGENQSAPAPWPPRPAPTRAGQKRPG